MKKSIILAILIYFSNTNLFSQENYFKGYIVTYNLDTIYGKITKNSDAEMHYQINFIDTLGNKSTLTTNSIISYKIDKDFYYTKMYPDSYDYYYFFKLVIDGKIKIYEYTSPPEDIMSGILRTASFNSMSGTNFGPNFQNQQKITFIEKDDLFKKVDGARFKGLMKKFVRDDQEIFAKVLDKTYEESELYILVRKYNENYQKRTN